MRYLLALLALVGLAAYLWFDSTGISPRPENAVIRGINYVSLSVSDLDRAAAYYGDALDLEVVDERPLAIPDALADSIGLETAGASTRMLRSSNAQLRLMHFDQPSAAAQATPRVEVNGPGFAHVCFQVARKTSAHDRLLAAGASPVGATEMVQLNPARPVEYAYVRDVDEIMFEIEHVDIPKLNLDTPPRNDYRMRHVALATPDYDRAVGFYSVLLEQKKPRRIGRLVSLSGENFDKVSGFKDAELKMAFFQVRNMELEIAQYISHPTETPSRTRPFDALGYNAIIFDVNDLDAAREKLIQAGGSVVQEAQEMDGGMILFGRDLDHNLLGFQKVTDQNVFSSQNFPNDGT